MKLHKLIGIETTSSIEGPDAPIAHGTRISRPNRNRSTVYSVRLSSDEVASVQELTEYAEYAEYAEAIPGPSRQATPIADGQEARVLRPGLLRPPSKSGVRGGSNADHRGTR